MKKLLIGGILLSSVALAGCSVQNVQQFLESKFDMVVKQDQQHEQGFVVDAESIYAAFSTGDHHLDLSNKDLIAIPDVCSLMSFKDAADLWSLDLSHNNIRILNVDLSCLTYLKKLDLSGNQIQAIQMLGDLPALRELNMQQNQLTTTADFPELPNLEKLNLAYNKIKQVVDLDHLENLSVLELQHNVIEYIVGVERLEKLEQLKIDYEKIKSGDFSPLLKKLGEKIDSLELVDEVGNVLGEEVKKSLLEKLKSGLGGGFTMPK